MGGYIMSSTINADTTNGVVVTSDTSGEIKLQSAGADIATVNNTGITLATGKDLTLSSTALDASASGIYLGGTAASNLLDNYEEGSWTPALTAVTPVTSVTYSHNTGRYRRIGDLVYITGAFQISARSGGSGQVVVDGLPFNVSDELPSTAVEANGSCSYFGGLTVAKSSVNVWAFNDSTKLYFTATAAGGSTTMPSLNITDTSAASFQLRFTLSYITDA
jgi:hypothetical protein